MPSASCAAKALVAVLTSVPDMMVTEGAGAPAALPSVAPVLISGAAAFGAGLTAGLTGVGAITSIFFSVM